MKFALVVQGRFHAFDLGKALLQRGHDVTLFTNYPRWAVRRFGFPEERVRSFWVHGVLTKGAYGLVSASKHRPERLLNPLFGRWASNELQKEHWDVIHSWSGVTEEIYTKPKGRGCLRLIMRGSAHIRTQDAILEQEEQRTGLRLERPDEWIKEREEREYNLADHVVVLSTFARNSFVSRGFPLSKLWLLPLGADTRMFRPNPEVVDARCRRILSGEPLRVLYVGALSLQKGLWDARDVVRRLAGKRFRFRFVGAVTADARSVAGDLRNLAELVPKVRQRELPALYSDADVFMFPTLQDGYAVVLAQAQASALPILTTPNCSGPDLVNEGETGWIRPIRNPEAFVETLLWCDANRPALAEMVRQTYASRRVRVWDDVAADFEQVCWDAPAASPIVQQRAVANG